MRKRIYLALVARLKAANVGVKHFSLWNENTEDLEQQNGFALPAVFVEFAPIQWGQRGGGVKNAQLRVILHIVTETLADPADGAPHQDEALQHLDAIDAIVAAAQGLSGEGFNGWQHVESVTDHNHEQVQHDTEAFLCEIRDVSAAKVLHPAHVADVGIRG